nr:acyltransferase [Bacilli bacterium]
TVLFFFIFSSFFYARTISREGYRYKDTLKRVLRLLIIAVVTMAIYYAVFLPLTWAKRGAPDILTEFNYKNFMQFYNRYRPKIGFAWFMLALILCYMLYPLINRIRWLHASRFSIIVPISILAAVYVFRIFAGKYDFGIWGEVQWTRNFLFTGLPAFMIGTYLYDNYAKIKKIRPAVFYPVFIATFLTAALEAYLHTEVIKTSVNEFYISNIVQAMIAVVYCIQNPEFRFGERLHYLFGSLCPTLMYLSNRGIIQLINSYMPKDAWVDLLEIGIPIVGCLAASALYYVLKRNLIAHRRKPDSENGPQAS